MKVGDAEHVWQHQRQIERVLIQAQVLEDDKERHHRHLPGQHHGGDAETEHGVASTPWNLGEPVGDNERRDDGKKGDGYRIAEDRIESGQCKGQSIPAIDKIIPEWAGLGIQTGGTV